MKWLLLLLLALAASETVLVSLEHEAAQEAERVFWNLMDPSHPTYGQWKSPQEIRHLFRPKKGSRRSAVKWLRSHGATRVSVVGSGDMLKATFPAGSQVHRAALPRFVSGLHVASKGYRGPLVKKRLVSGSSGVASPSQQRDSYGIPSGVVGNASSGLTQMVWGPGTYGYSTSDLSTFWDQFGVSNSLSNVRTTGFPGVPGGDNFGEGSLDVQQSTSIGPSVVTIVSNTNTSESTEETTGFGYAFLDFLNELPMQSDKPAVLSLSLGSLSYYSCNELCTQAQQKGVSASDCAQYISQQRQVCMLDSTAQIAAMNVQLQKIGMRGTTVVAAAGDGGSHFSFTNFPHDHIGRILNEISCKYNFPTYPSSSPYLVSVGGTQWKDAPSIHEPVHWVAGGAGFSWVSPMPAFQQKQVQAYLSAYGNSRNFPSPGSFNASNRAYPDVSAVADDIPLTVGGSTFSSGGTSASTPEFAGFLSLIINMRQVKGLPPYLGALNTRMYQAAAALGSDMFFDVTQGDTSCGIDVCCDEGFPAATGWDVPSGLGSPLWGGFLKEFSKP